MIRRVARILRRVSAPLTPARLACAACSTEVRVIYIVVFGLLVGIPIARCCWRKYSRVARQASVDALRAAPSVEPA